MPAIAWDLFCSAWFSVISHWLTTNFSFSHCSCFLSGWQCLVVLWCSPRFIGSVHLSQASAFPWPAMSPASCCPGPNECAPHVNQTSANFDGLHRLDWLQLALCGADCTCLARYKASYWHPFRQHQSPCRWRCGQSRDQMALMRNLFWPDTLSPYITFSLFSLAWCLPSSATTTRRLGFLLNVAAVRAGLDHGSMRDFVLRLCGHHFGSVWLSVIACAGCVVLIIPPTFIVRIHLRAATSQSIRDAQRKLHLLPTRTP